MEIVTLDDVQALDKKSSAPLKVLFEKVKGQGTVKFGTIKIPPGVRVPGEGFGVHSGDEYSLVLKGMIKSVSGGKEHRLISGQASFIPAGEEHWSVNDGQEDCEIVWVLIE